MNLLDIHGTRQGYVVEIIKASAIKATHYVHYIIEYDRFMEGALLRNRAPGGIDARPFSVLNLVTEQVVKSLLARVDSTKDEDGRVHDDSGVSIAWLGSHALQSLDLKPELLTSLLTPETVSAQVV